MTKALVALALLFALCGAVASSARDDVISVIREQLEAGKDIDDLDDNDNETDDYDVKPKRKAGPSTGSCREARLCCEGRDPSCSVTGSANANSIFDEPGAACYCDHACMAVGDCCRDYKQTCGGKCEKNMDKIQCDLSCANVLACAVLGYTTFLVLPFSCMEFLFLSTALFSHGGFSFLRYRSSKHYLATKTPQTEKERAQERLHS